MTVTTTAVPWDKADFERRLAESAALPLHPSHSGWTRSKRPACVDCGVFRGEMASKQPCAPTAHVLARKAERAASLRDRMAIWEAMPAHMQAVVRRPQR